MLINCSGRFSNNTAEGVQEARQQYKSVMFNARQKSTLDSSVKACIHRQCGLSKYIPLNNSDKIA